MEAAQRDLDRMRSSSGAWIELQYERVAGVDGYDGDANAVRRATVLWAMQYDRRAEDLSLLRWLVEQEARCRREAPFQGLSEETELAGFLLAENRRVHDVWLHWEIKRANFDTWCGYDLEHLVAAGVEASVAFVRGSGHADREDVLERLQEQDERSPLSEDGVAAWFGRKRSRFPADPADEHPLTWVERAKLVGELDVARSRLDEWSAGRPRDRDLLTLLRNQLADLGDHVGAAAVQRESLAFADTAWDAASAWRSLAGLHRRAGDHDSAWEALRECRQALDGVADWREFGLGRGYVEELFLLAGTSAGALAGTVFAEADRQAQEVPGLPLVVLHAAADAAEKVGPPGRAVHYRELRDAEQRRIDAEPAGSGD